MIFFQECGGFCQIRSLKCIAKWLVFSQDSGEVSHGQPVSKPPFLDIGPISWGGGGKKQKKKTFESLRNVDIFDFRCGEEVV